MHWRSVMPTNPARLVHGNVQECVPTAHGAMLAFSYLIAGRWQVAFITGALLV